MDSGKDETHFSVNAVFVLVILLVVVFGWGFLAGSYTGAHETKFSESEYADPEHPKPPPDQLPDRLRFFHNAINQLPNLPTVVAWNFRHRLWLPLLLVGVLAAVITGGVIMNRIDRELKQPYKVKHRKR